MAYGNKRLGIVSGINENGRPWTSCEGCSDFIDNELIDSLEPESRETATRWVRENLKPAKTPCYGYSSYVLKHYLESDTDVYMTNNQFKDLLLSLGFKPVPDTENEINWDYYISKRSPAFTKNRR